MSSKQLIAYFCIFTLGTFIFQYHKKQTITSSVNKTTTIVLKEIIKTGSPVWPYRLKLKTITQQPHYYFFIYTKKFSRFKIDDVLEISIPPLKKPTKEEFQNYLFKEGVTTSVFLPFFKATLKHRPYYSFARWLNNTQYTLTMTCKKKLSPIAFAFFSSLFLGDKGIAKQTIEPYKPHFQEWGIAHYLAKSGFHLLIFILVWHFLISIVPLPFFVKQCFLICICTLYFFLTPSSISFIRSFFLFLLSKILSLLNWQAHTINILSIICFTSLIINPFYLFFLDFQLSFYLTFCLSWIAQLNRQKRMLL